MVCEGMVIIVLRLFEKESNIEVVDMLFDIRYEDEYLLILNKFSGLVVYLVFGYFNDILVNVLMYYFKNNLLDVNGLLCLGIVYRIDKDISGFLIIVKDNEIYNELVKMFKNY